LFPFVAYDASFAVVGCSGRLRHQGEVNTQQSMLTFIFAGLQAMGNSAF